jgi:hypothetical protein
MFESMAGSERSASAPQAIRLGCHRFCKGATWRSLRGSHHHLNNRLEIEEAGDQKDSDGSKDDVLHVSPPQLADEDRNSHPPPIFILILLALDPGIGLPLGFNPKFFFKTRSAFAIRGLSSVTVFTSAQVLQWTLQFSRVGSPPRPSGITCS